MNNILDSKELVINATQDFAYVTARGTNDSTVVIPIEKFRAMIREIAVKCEANSQMFIVIRNAIREANETKDFDGALGVVADAIGETWL